MFPDFYHCKLLKLIEVNPSSQQSEIAKAKDVSLGKTNYSLQALVQKSMMDNFCRNGCKHAFSYLLTASDIEAKARFAVSFRGDKIAGYSVICCEIEELLRDMERGATA